MEAQRDHCLLEEHRDGECRASAKVARGRAGSRQHLLAGSGSLRSRLDPAALCPPAAGCGGLESTLMMRSIESSTASRRAVRRLPLCASLLALSLMATCACSTPVAIGAMVVGTGSFVAGAVGYEECSDDDSEGPEGAHCGLSNLMP